jgi:Tol biopolymer transport system component
MINSHLHKEYDTLGSNKINLSNNPAVMHSTPDWSKTENKIVFTSNQTANIYIYIMNLDGSNIIGIPTNHSSLDSFPKWRY